MPLTTTSGLRHTRQRSDVDPASVPLDSSTRTTRALARASAAPSTMNEIPRANVRAAAASEPTVANIHTRPTACRCITQRAPVTIEPIARTPTSCRTTADFQCTAFDLRSAGSIVSAEGSARPTLHLQVSRVAGVSLDCTARSETSAGVRRAPPQQQVER